METKINNKFSVIIKIVLLLLLTIMVGFSYTNHEYYLEFSRPITIVFIVLFFLSFNWIRPFNESRFFKTVLCLFLLLCLFLPLLISINLNNNEFSPSGEFRELLIPLLSLIIGYNLKLNEKQCILIVMVYAVVILFFVGLKIRTDIGGYVISEQSEFVGKNTIGVSMATIGAILIQITYSDQYNSKFKVIAAFGVIVSLLFLLTMRGRTATLTLMLIVSFVTFIYMFRHNTPLWLKAILLVIITLILISMFTSIELLPGVRGYIYDSFYLGKEKDVLSDRGVRNEQALEIIDNSPIWGRLSYYSNVEWVHNYPLLKMSNYGLLGSLPWLLLYVYILVFSIRRVLAKKSFNIMSFGYIMMWAPYFISMGEPTLPYGPGTVTVFNFVMLGVAVYNDKK